MTEEHRQHLRYGTRHRASALASEIELTHNLLCRDLIRRRDQKHQSIAVNADDLGDRLRFEVLQVMRTRHDVNLTLQADCFPR